VAMLPQDGAADADAAPAAAERPAHGEDRSASSANGLF